MIIFDDIADEVKGIPIEFPFPDLANPLYISRKTIVHDGKVIGAGLVRLTGEGILILDKEQPLISRARGAMEVIEALKQDVKRKGLDECHVFVRDANVQYFLKRLGFIECKGGTPLVIHF
jgi:hypothetical protein